MGRFSIKSIKNSLRPGTPTCVEFIGLPDIRVVVTVLSGDYGVKVESLTPDPSFNVYYRASTLEGIDQICDDVYREGWNYQGTSHKDVVQENPKPVFGETP